VIQHIVLIKVKEGTTDHQVRCSTRRMKEDAASSRRRSLRPRCNPLACVDCRHPCVTPCQREGGSHSPRPSRRLTLLERTVLTTVPWPHRGAGRRVYPGFLQVNAFMGLSPCRHLSAFAKR
jgi:poly(3-hydroxybutyrate) depolymerase